MFPSTTFTATRPSTLATTLDDKGGLFPYMTATTLQQIASNRVLSDRFAMTDASDWRNYKTLYEDAQRHRGSPEADHGSLIHSAVEMLVTGADLTNVPEKLLDDARAVVSALAASGLTPVESEQHVVTAGLPEFTAGTLDMLVGGGGDLYVADVKSVKELGSLRFKSLSWAIQLAIYARGFRYTGKGFGRDRWGRPYVDPARIDTKPTGIHPSRGFVVEVVRDGAMAVVHELDLDIGWEAAEFACRLRELRRTSAAVHRVPAEVSDAR
jgi:hypothetical protein